MSATAVVQMKDATCPAPPHFVFTPLSFQTDMNFIHEFVLRLELNLDFKGINLFKKTFKLFSHLTPFK